MTWPRSVVLLALLSGGCTIITPERIVPKAVQPAKASGYVGGIFTKDTIAQFGFGVRNVGTNALAILPVVDKDVGLIALPPGTYRVENWVAFAVVGNDRIAGGDVPASSRLARSFELRAGEVVLIGKWAADRDGRTYELTPAKIGEAEAVAAFRGAYPKFADAPVSCVVCTP